jgi:hypothetical protein
MECSDTATLGNLAHFSHFFICDSLFLENFNFLYLVFGRFRAKHKKRNTKHHNFLKKEVLWPLGSRN